MIFSLKSFPENSSQHLWFWIRTQLVVLGNSEREATRDRASAKTTGFGTRKGHQSGESSWSSGAICAFYQTRIW